MPFQGDLFEYMAELQKNKAAAVEPQAPITAQPDYLPDFGKYYTVNSYII